MAKKIPRQALSVALLDTLEEELQTLRVAYERYFLGIDKRPPERARTEVERKIRRMGIGAMGSTALRFRLDGLRGRFVTYSQHWKRVCRQIEAGTYVRVVAEAERRRRMAAFEARVARDKARIEQDKQVREAAADGAPDPSPTKPGAVSSPLGPPPVSSARAGIEVPGGRALYEQYVQARRAAGQSTEGLNYASMMKTIARQRSQIKAKHGGDVRFEVATKDGRVKLVAKVQK